MAVQIFNPGAALAKTGSNIMEQLWQIRMNAEQARAKSATEQAKLHNDRVTAATTLLGNKEAMADPRIRRTVMQILRGEELGEDYSEAELETRATDTRLRAEAKDLLATIGDDTKSPAAKIDAERRLADINFYHPELGIRSTFQSLQKIDPRAVGHVTQRLPGSTESQKILYGQFYNAWLKNNPNGSWDEFFEALQSRFPDIVGSPGARMNAEQRAETAAQANERNANARAQGSGAMDPKALRKAYEDALLVRDGAQAKIRHAILTRKYMADFSRLGPDARKQWFALAARPDATPEIKETATWFQSLAQETGIDIDSAEGWQKIYDFAMAEGEKARSQLVDANSILNSMIKRHGPQLRAMGVDVPDLPATPVQPGTPGAGPKLPDPGAAIRAEQERRRSAPTQTQVREGSPAAVRQPSPAVTEPVKPAQIITPVGPFTVRQRSESRPITIIPRAGKALRETGILPPQNMKWDPSTGEAFFDPYKKRWFGTPTAEQRKAVERRYSLPPIKKPKITPVTSRKRGGTWERPRPPKTPKAA